MATQPIDPWEDDVARIDQIVAHGMSEESIYRRVASKRWQRPAPGVVVRTTGELMTRQRQLVALAYGGESAQLSHQTAGAYWGLSPAATDVHVTVRHGRHLSSRDFIVIHQTTREPPARMIDGLPLTPAPRTAIDLCLGLDRIDDVRGLLGRAVQQGLASPVRLEQELASAPSRGSLLPRLVLEEITAGARSAPEGRLYRLLVRAQLPLPELNAPVETAAGTKFVDALWRTLGKGVEIDGQPFHLNPASWAADLARQNAIQAAGIVLLRIPARRLWQDPDGVLAEIIHFLGISC